MQSQSRKKMVLSCQEENCASSGSLLGSPHVLSVFTSSYHGQGQTHHSDLLSSFFCHSTSLAQGRFSCQVRRKHKLFPFIFDLHILSSSISLKGHSVSVLLYLSSPDMWNLVLQSCVIQYFAQMVASFDSQRGEETTQ